MTSLRRTWAVVLAAIVAEQHRAHWRSLLWALPNQNTIIQPVNRGTANGVLPSALSILRRDPLARIVFLPADHYVRDERTLMGTLRSAILQLTRTPEKVVLVGIEPDEPDPELGYIVPGDNLRCFTSSIRYSRKSWTGIAGELGIPFTWIRAMVFCTLDRLEPNSPGWMPGLEIGW